MTKRDRANRFAGIPVSQHRAKFVFDQILHKNYLRPRNIGSNTKAAAPMPIIIAFCSIQLVKSVAMPGSGGAPVTVGCPVATAPAAPGACTVGIEPASGM